MGRLFLLAILLAGLGIALARPPAPPQVAHGTSPTLADSPAPGPTVAYRPGEPQLLTDQVTELRRAADGHFYADVTVNGRPVAMLVDTGASTVALTVGDAQQLGMAVDPATFGVVGSGASGPVRGMAVTLDEVALGPLRAGPVPAVVLEGLDRSLLGQSWLGRLQQVRIEGDRMTLR
ncbi:retropepsin-like aspartic protease family protein [Sphingomonas sp.]|jgi:aspartyl protease family protein|uniref:retropepsin-like aspartic protease family protein n=1 Tax=Sphingomonas sp. TaxID=28214 RepID=UPI002D81103A|nr:TIGR02281 family clan AA aspartic protease [Sphingomonas sp.]HEU0043027.1 TIGR02281 family clan AA aspartic protease [Sphingomonas sp.]